MPESVKAVALLVLSHPSMTVGRCGHRRFPSGPLGRAIAIGRGIGPWHARSAGPAAVAVR